MIRMRRVKDQDTQRSFTRRTLLLAGGKLALMTALGARLYYLQVMEADRYRTLSEENQFNLELLPPIRGRILDRNGVAMATNRDNFRIELVSEQTGDVARTIEALRSLVRIDDWDVKRVMRDVQCKRSFVPVTVVENLSREDIARIAVNAPYLPGVRIEVGRSRHYPHGPRAVHVTGYVAAVSESELTGDPVLELPDFRIGKNGIEKSHDLEMRGTAGQRQVEVNAFGRIIRKLPGNDGQPGQDMHLTIDMELQGYCIDRLAQGRSERVPLSDPRVAEAMAAQGTTTPADPITGNTVLLDAKGRLAEEESGAAVVVDVHRGEILALTSNPGFDPNSFNKGLSARDWEELLSHPRAPMSNKAIAGQFPPGSTYKMVVALAALEANVVTASTEVYCPGHFQLGDTKFHCWRYRGGHGRLSMVQAIAQSCDVYFYEVARRTGIDRIAEMSRRLGLGEKIGIDLPGERPGLVPSREWKLAARGESWQQGETINTGIGQGFLLTTPLQLVTMVARLANGGYAVKPRLLQGVAGRQPELQSLGINPQNLEVVMKGMYEVINGRRGTAYVTRLQNAGFEFAGKTGSAQVRRITKAERATKVKENKDLPWRERDHALFVGYAPADAPRYACAVVVEHGGSGTGMAAPVCRDILVETVRLDPARVISAELRERTRAAGQPSG